MGLRINTNVASINAQRHIMSTRRQLDSSFERLSSGYRINKASDDAAGLAISENLKAQIRGLRQARRNASDGISMIQTAEGGLNEVSSIMIRLRELAVQASSDTIGQTEREFINVEFQQLKDEIQRIAESTVFNGKSLLDGLGGILDVQIGIYNDEFQDRIKFDATSSAATLEALGLATEFVNSKLGAQNSLAVIDNAIVRVNAIRATMGAVQNRLTSTVNNLSIYEENLAAANSRVRDVDVAEETANMTRNSIMTQAGIAVLSQANQTGTLALALLQ